MKLIQLKEYVENDYDKALINRMSRDSEANLNNYVISVVSDLINTLLFDKNLKLSVVENINSYDDKSLGSISSYVSLIPYLQLELRDNKDMLVIANSYLEILISYIVGYTSKEDFDAKIEEMKSILKISDKFYESILTYFVHNNEEIKIQLQNKIKL